MLSLVFRYGLYYEAPAFASKTSCIASFNPTYLKMTSDSLLVERHKRKSHDQQRSKGYLKSQSNYLIGSRQLILKLTSPSFFPTVRITIPNSAITINRILDQFPHK